MPMTFIFADRLRAAALADEDILAAVQSFGGPSDYPKSLHDDILPFLEVPGLL
jgi:aminobenzoyl-glutamate utilization protein B